MNIWVQEINGTPHMCLQFSPEEKPLLERWYRVITRMTRLNFGPYLGRKDDE